MSEITNIILKTAVDDTAAAGFIDALAKITECNTPLLRVDQMVTGKAMELDLYIAAYNYLDINDALKLFKKTNWECPEEAQLLIQRQDDDLLISHTP